MDLDTQYADATNVDARAALYARYRRAMPFKTWVLENLEGPDETRVLDVGSGPAGLWCDHADRLPAGRRITVLDRSAGMLRDARKRAGSTGVQLAPVRADATALPFPDGTFGLATACHMLYDVSDLDRAVRELRRVLGPEGTLHATTNAIGHLTELPEALYAVGVRGDFVEERAHSSFSLENGPEVLGRVFEDVRVLRQTEVLEADDAQPLLDYARSLEHVDAQLTPERTAAFRDLVEETIAREGSFRLRTDSGMFLARG